MVVSMHEPRAAPVRSVGEKDSPWPMLSLGASVMKVLPESRWRAWQRSRPW